MSVLCVCVCDVVGMGEEAHTHSGAHSIPDCSTQKGAMDPPHSMCMFVDLGISDFTL